MKDVYRLSAFPKTLSGGNPAGVVLNADNLSELEMLEIAKEIGYSETAFVLKSKIADFKLRFFTPVVEVDLCGHATIATFNLLKMKDIVRKGTYFQETKVGVLRIDIEKDRVYMEQNKPVFGEKIKLSDISKCFDNVVEVDKHLPIIIASTGLKEIFLPVSSIDSLNSLKPNYEAIVDISKRYGVIGIHAFSLDREVDAYGRNFAPYVGINEESATGTSNGALGCYLFEFLKDKKTEYILRQGYSMNMPSQISVKLNIKNNKIEKVFVGGTANIIE